MDFQWLLDPVKDSKPYWFEIFQTVLPTLAVIYSLCHSYKNWEKQKIRELEIAEKQQTESARIAACKAVWSLLAYMSDNESSKTVYVKRADEKWYLRVAQARQYILDVEEVFYLQGHGLFMPKTVRNGMYEFRRSLYRLMDSERFKKNTNELADTEIMVENEGVITAKKQLFDQLNKELRQLITTGDYSKFCVR
jgi:hypothetical protein